MEYLNRCYIVFNTSELSLVNFTEVNEDSVNTVRKSIDETLTFVKWGSEVLPSFIQSMSTIQGAYNYNEIITILNTSKWSVSIT